MSPNRSVEELLTKTLERAGELAVTADLHVPIRSVLPVGEINEGPWDRAAAPSPRSWWVAVSGIAALVLVAVGLMALVRTSPSITVDKTRLSAAQGEQLLCGAPGCSSVFHASVGPPSQSGADNAGSAFGADRSVPSHPSLGTWIVARNGEFERTIAGTTRAGDSGKRTKSGSVYLSDGGGRYYRFTIRGDGMLRVIGHGADTVTLKGTDGTRYVLDLQTTELRPEP